MSKEVDQLVRLVKSKFDDYRESGDDIRVCCPFCPTRGRSVDKEFKLYINPVRNVTHCFRCEYSGRADVMFPQLVAFDISTETKKPESTDLEPLPHCVEISKLSTTSLAYEYATLVRGFTLSELQNKVFFCEDYCKPDSHGSDYSFGPRLIFPFYQFGLYKGFQARTIWKNTEPKYIGASGMKKKNVLYNFDIAFSQKEELIITEGPFDSIRVGPTSVALLGKAISDEQLRLVQLGDFKKIIVLLDPGTKKEGKETTKALARYFNTFGGELKDKDPGEMTFTEIQEVLQTVERVF